MKLDSRTLSARHRAYLLIKNLGNKLCHDICRPAEDVENKTLGCSDGQLEEQTYSYYILRIKEFLEDLRKDGRLKQCMDSNLKFMSDLPASLNIKSYVDLTAFLKRKDNERYEFNMKVGRFAKAFTPEKILTDAEKAAIAVKKEAKKARIEAAEALRKMTLPSTPLCSASSLFNSSSESSESSGEEKEESEEARTKRKRPIGKLAEISRSKLTKMKSE